MRDFSTNGDFQYLESYLGTGANPPDGWQPLKSFPFLILVGGVGAGKSTTVDALKNQGLDFLLLPNRREITNKLIITPLLREDNSSIRTLKRSERLPYVLRYQQRHPAGVAYALSQLFLDPQQIPVTLFFDGLRGEEEIPFAIETFPKTMFIALEANNQDRLLRLIERKDPYDSIHPTQPDLKEREVITILGMPEASSILSPDQEKEILSLIQKGSLDPKEVEEKIHILSEERSLYDVSRAIRLLTTLAPKRTLVIDTTQFPPTTVANQIIEKLKHSFSHPNLENS